MTALSNKEIAERLRGLDDVSPDLCRLAAERLEGLEAENAEVKEEAVDYREQRNAERHRSLSDPDRERLREIADKWLLELRKADADFLRDLASRDEKT